MLSGTAGTIVGPVTGIDLGTILTPRPVDFVGNLFEQDRPGDAVVRPDDLVALRIETRNLAIIAGTPPRLKKQASGAAYVILHFPPQSITEETFFETQPAGTKNPAAQRPDEQVKQDPVGGSETPHAPPVRARIAGESRLVFQVPDGFDVAYTLREFSTPVRRSV
ncbi:hypothetical protein A4U53_005225 (plasmid) [Rhizobium ruizarguesonis]|uniref:Uncharacterized protein n=1 Tax=Rhizobium ruizarguesonis TaxID=2081791 RepID=A0ACD5EH89_9HYPH